MKNKFVITLSMKNDLVQKVTDGQLTVSQAALKYGVPEMAVKKWVGDITNGSPADSPASTSPLETGAGNSPQLPATEMPQHSAISTASPTAASSISSLWWIPLIVVGALWLFLGFRDLLVFLVWALLLGCILAVLVKTYRLSKALRPGGNVIPGKNRLPSARVDGMIASASLLLSIACWFLLPVVRSIPVEPTSGATSRPGLTADELALSSHTVYGYWKEGDTGLRGGDDESSWIGTAGVLRTEGDHLILVSNSHCLSLEDLLTADEPDPSLDAPEILEYKLVVEFASGITQEVIQCGDQHGAMDLALLKVDATGLSEGTDYVLLPIGNTGQIKPGDEVVAVGSPEGLRGTQTYGRISAVRNPPHGENDVGFNHDRIFQTDAAINHGNSGGPLFVLSSADTYTWIGVNTWIFNNANNLGFAIDAKSVMDSSYDWFNADADGVIAHLNAIYDY